MSIFGTRDRDRDEAGVGAFPADAPYPAGVDQPGPGAPVPAPPGRGLPPGLDHRDRPTESEQVLELLMGLEHGRQGLLDRLWAELTANVDERAWLGSATVLQVAPQATGLVKITSVIATIPTDQTGTLVLGDWQMPLPAGVTVLPFVGILLNASDLRQLTSTGAGALSLRLMGHVLPTRGVMNQ